MAEVPPEHRGVPAREWEEDWLAKSRKAGKLCDGKNDPTHISKKPETRFRDGYGWRSLPAGTRYLGAK
jgi:hypothetical protein